MKRLLAPVIAGVAVVVVAGLGAARVAGQQPAFEAASIKANTLGAPRSGRLLPGRLEQTSVTLRDLIGMAYGRQEISGAPNWIDSDRYDVMATGDFTLAGFLPGSDGSPPIVYVMLRSLLTERFKLAVHDTTVEQPVYALSLARNDQRLGAGLRHTDVDCAAVLAAQTKGQPPDVPASARRPPCSLRVGPGRINGNAISMGQLANALNGRADRPVVDQTGLTGYFDVDFEWGEMQAGPSDLPPPQGSHAGDDEPIFTALRNELGLKLESTRRPVEILVVDHVEHPTAD